MLFLQLSFISNHFWLNWEKPISFFKSPPPLVQNWPNCTRGGGDLQNKIGFSQFNQKWLEIKLSCKNNIFYPISQQFKSRRRRFSLRNWLISWQLYYKIKMGVAGSIFESCPPNFAKCYTFLRWINDVTGTFWNIY